MAFVEIDVWENEDALYDFSLTYNGSVYATDENYTTEANAIAEASLRAQEAWANGV